MNTIQNEEGNLIKYGEQAFTIINDGDNNSYKENNKNKIADLVDISGDITKSEIENYEKFLNNILSLIDSYMKEVNQFTLKEYDRSITIYRVIYFQICWYKWI